MKNKGRQHISRLNMNCKGCLTHITRAIESMSPRGDELISKFDKKKWSKRVRGYLKNRKGQEIFL